MMRVKLRNCAISKLQKAPCDEQFSSILTSMTDAATEFRIHVLKDSQTSHTRQ